MSGSEMDRVWIEIERDGAIWSDMERNGAANEMRREKLKLICLMSSGINIFFKQKSYFHLKRQIFFTISKNENIHFVKIP